MIPKAKEHLECPSTAKYIFKNMIPLHIKYYLTINRDKLLNKYRMIRKAF